MAVLEQFVQWFQVPSEEEQGTFAFKNGIAYFQFGSQLTQLQPHCDARRYTYLPYDIKPQVDAELAREVRKYMIGYYAGNKHAEMLERALEAIAFIGLGQGLDKVKELCSHPGICPMGWYLGCH